MKSSLEGDSQVTKRNRLTSAGNYTGEYVSKDNILASVGIGSKKFVGEILATHTYRRPRDTQNRTLEQITTQEVINDHRESLIRYEGTLRSSSRRFLGMHHKIWFNYVGYTDPVSCYIDGMKYNVKRQPMMSSSICRIRTMMSILFLKLNTNKFCSSK